MASATLPGVVTPTLVRVPNQPKTPISNFRIPAKLKTAAVEKAKTEARTLTSVVIEKLEEYVEET